jgi:hypothetical protein
MVCSQWGTNGRRYSEEQPTEMWLKRRINGHLTHWDCVLGFVTVSWRLYKYLRVSTMDTASSPELVGYTLAHWVDLVNALLYNSTISQNLNCFWIIYYSGNALGLCLETVRNSVNLFELGLCWNEHYCCCLRSVFQKVLSRENFGNVTAVRCSESTF